MGYIFDHTVFYDGNIWYWLPVIFMVATLIFCVVRVQKMKSVLETAKEDLASKLAEHALTEPEPIMRNAIEEPAEEVKT